MHIKQQIKQLSADVRIWLMSGRQILFTLNKTISVKNTRWLKSPKALDNKAGLVK